MDARSVLERVLHLVHAIQKENVVLERVSLYDTVMMTQTTALARAK